MVYRRYATKQELEATERKLMNKLSELKGIFDGVDMKLDAIKAAVVSLKGNQAGDPDLPADAQAALDQLKMKVDDILVTAHA